MEKTLVLNSGRVAVITYTHHKPLTISYENGGRYSIYNNVRPECVTGKTLDEVRAYCEEYLSKWPVAKPYILRVDILSNKYKKAAIVFPWVEIQQINAAANELSGLEFATTEEFMQFCAISE